MWTPGDQHGYHAVTYGWLVGEVVRRITGQTVGQFFAENVAAPLGLEFWIGLPEEHLDRVAPLIPMALPEGLHFGDPGAPMPDLVEMLSMVLGPDNLIGRALTAPGGAMTDQDHWNDPAVWQAEFPAANGITNAGSLARMYAATVSEVDGVRLLDPDTLSTAVERHTYGADSVLMFEIPFALGFMLDGPLSKLGSPTAFGHYGAGGSVGFADHEAEIGFGYAMNRMDLGIAGDPRTSGLIDAVYAASVVTTPSVEAARRRTFAIISHPDAGKTTLTEKFLLYGGALGREAGSVKARQNRRSATSDWMALEQQRGISITSTVLQFPFRGCVVNLLDTPGHRDFSEDTYRVLTAADAAVMVLDAAKGIEAQTLKLFEVCRDRELPLLTFINKWDRPGRDGLELLDEIENQIGVTPTPVTWPVGIPGDFRGVIDRRTGEYVRFTRTVHGSTIAPEELVDAERAAEEEGDAWATAIDEIDLLEATGANHDDETFLAGVSTPTFVGSALTNFGVGHLLDAVIDLFPAPAARSDVEGVSRGLDAPFAGFVFKVQANMDPAHRDRIAFFRVCSGRFERGMVVTHERTGKPFATKYAHQVFGQDRETVEEAYPGDVVGLVNAGDVRVGDSIYVDEPVTFPPIPSFAPEHFSIARVRDTGRYKQFRSGITQLDEEGVVQVLRDKDRGDQAPVLAAVGPMQFEVVSYRLENEFGASIELSPTSYVACRRTDAESRDRLRAMRGVDVLERSDGALLALFESTYWLERLVADEPDLTLDKLVAEGALAR